MDQATARYIRPIERSEPSLTLGEGADMSAGMGTDGTVSVNAYSIVTLDYVRYVSAMDR